MVSARTFASSLEKDVELGSSGQTRRGGLPVQLTWISVGLGLCLLTVVTLVGWWAVQRIDDRALNDQSALAHAGLQEQADELPLEQDSSAVWDDAVTAVRLNDGPWMAENLVEWMSEYYGHDRVYVLDPDNQPLRAAEDGTAAPRRRFEADAAAVLPLVERLRRSMAEAASGLEDSTEAVLGQGELDFVQLEDSKAVIVSVRPILPSSDAITQKPGDEYLLVSVQALNSALTDLIASKYKLDELAYNNGVDGPEISATIPVTSASGRIIGFLSWQAKYPARELVTEVGPFLFLGGLFGAGVLTLLVVRLRKTSGALQVSEAQAQFLAFHDPLTEIPNRALFEDRLERALASVRRSSSRIALHYLDLDRFKHVNDTLGHPAGDELIRQVADRLSACVRDVDTVARLGGDEFAIIQIDPADDKGAEVLCDRIIDVISHPFDLNGDEADVGVSIGVVLSSQTDGTPQDMMRKADIALYQAKATGRGRHQIFVGDLDDQVRQRRALERELRTAIAGDELTLAYQPLYNVDGTSIVGAEALVRWNHPIHGLLSPDHFIGLAEERGLIGALGMWVLQQACAFAVTADLDWIAVNFSPAQFHDEHLADRVLLILTELGLAPERLEIEITEGLLLEKSPTVQSTLGRLREAGVRIALDDFGTGYSSITYLRTYRIDKLKIDRSFVDQLGHDNEIDEIVRAIIQLARVMKMQVAAEGVETPLQHKMLQQMGCDELQGYYLSKPVTPERLLHMTSANRPHALSAHR
jgi:diguanylate cyclase (GGDEF)-like protein